MRIIFAYYFIGSDEFYDARYHGSYYHHPFFQLCRVVNQYDISVDKMNLVWDLRSSSYYIRIRYEINYNTIFCLSSSWSTSHLFASYSLHTQAKMTYWDRANCRLLSRSDGFGRGVDDDKTQRDLRLWCPLLCTPASDKSLFSDISNDNIIIASRRSLNTMSKLIKEIKI